MTSPLYSLRSCGASYTMTKLDSDFNIAAVYNLTAQRGLTTLSAFACDCPANSRSVILHLCKHRRMLPLMLPEANTGRFYNPETKTWSSPFADAVGPEAIDSSPTHEPPTLPGEAVSSALPAPSRGLRR